MSIQPCMAELNILQDFEPREAFIYVSFPVLPPSIPYSPIWLCYEHFYAVNKDYAYTILTDNRIV